MSVILTKQDVEKDSNLQKWLNYKNAGIQLEAEHRVDHPSHYTAIPGIECIDVVKYHDFCTGNAIKYLWRAGLKKEEGISAIDKEIEDLEKARWYIDVRIKFLKNGTR